MLDPTHALFYSWFAEIVEGANNRLDEAIALIGDNWTAHDRLHDPADFVRLEISSALKRDITVIPVLVRGAKLPDAAALPEDIQPLRRHQAISISDDDWDHGCERLKGASGSFGPASQTVEYGDALGSCAGGGRHCLAGALPALQVAQCCEPGFNSRYDHANSRPRDHTRCR